MGTAAGAGRHGPLTRAHPGRETQSVSDNLRRYGDLLRLYERGHVLDTVHPSMFADEAMPWATVVREVGFTNIDARADFERAIHTFDEPSPRARDVRSARAAI